MDTPHSVTGTCRRRNASERSEVSQVPVTSVHLRMIEPCCPYIFFLLRPLI
jgi:hypothetical protein